MYLKGYTGTMSQLLLWLKHIVLHSGMFIKSIIPIVMHNFVHQLGPKSQILCGIIILKGLLVTRLINPYRIQYVQHFEACDLIIHLQLNAERCHMIESLVSVT